MPFCSVMLFFIMSFALYNSVILNFQNNTAIGFEKYIELLGSVYQILFGENPDAKKMDVFNWGIYVVFTLII